MTNQVKHHKAFRCRIENTGRIYRIKDNWYIHINTTDSLQITIGDILENHKDENIVIKSEKGGSGNLIITQGEKNKDHIKGYGASPEKDTTKWLRLIKSDGTVWTITDNHYVGEKVQ